MVQPDDWRGYVQLLAVVCGTLVSLGALAIFVGEDRAADEPGLPRGRSLSMDGEITFLEVRYTLPPHNMASRVLNLTCHV